MARLDVQILDAKDGNITKVEFEGDVYRKVEGPAEKGDLALVVNPWGNQAKGAFYRVINGDHRLYDGDKSWVYIYGEKQEASSFLSDVILFRKKKITDFNEGDKVQLLEGGGEFPLYGFEDGEIYIVRRTDYEHSRYLPEKCIEIVNESGKSGYALPEQLEIFSRKKDTVIPEGYEVVDRKPRVGDKILVTSAFMSGCEYTNGDILTVKKANPNNVEVEETDIGLLFSEFEVIERKDEKTLKVGDFARVVQQGHRNKGKIVKIVEDDRASVYPYRTQLLNGEAADVHSFDHLEKVSPEEVFEVGDRVRVVMDDGEEPKYDWGAVSNYEEGTVQRVRFSDEEQEWIVYVDFPSQSRWMADPSELVIVEKASEQHEISKGDIVRITRFQHGAKKGELVEVIHVSETDIMYETVDHSYFASLDAVELVAKASARVDKNVEVDA